MEYIKRLVNLLLKVEEAGLSVISNPRIWAISLLIIASATIFFIFHIDRGRPEVIIEDTGIKNTEIIDVGSPRDFFFKPMTGEDYENLLKEKEKIRSYQMEKFEKDPEAKEVYNLFSELKGCDSFFSNHEECNKKTRKILLHIARIVRKKEGQSLHHLYKLLDSMMSNYFYYSEIFNFSIEAIAIGYLIDKGYLATKNEIIGAFTILFLSSKVKIRYSMTYSDFLGSGLFTKKKERTVPKDEDYVDNWHKLVKEFGKTSKRNKHIADLADALLSRLLDPDITYEDIIDSINQGEYEKIRRRMENAELKRLLYFVDEVDKLFSK